MEVYGCCFRGVTCTTSRPMIIPYIQFIQANPLTDMEEADYQSLHYSARQEPRNLAQYTKWCKFITASIGKHFQCKKKLSDSPALTVAVAKEQSIVVKHQIRTFSNKFKLYIPHEIDAIIILYYTQPAIYPKPMAVAGPIRWTHTYNARTCKWVKYGPLSWKIDEGESLNDIHHPFNQEDAAQYKAALESPKNIPNTTITKRGQWKAKIHWHKWHY